MTKLIAAFLATPTPAAAKRLVSYLQKHPMAECMANPLELGLIRQAEALAR